ncbi:serine/threonine protein kinase [Aerosakkonema sp. BLCC-F183]|uniref:serine/threonine protein kinase n=1 Tax=Aerosakkonema sp. BLCC-F183 TaxID=3342834 RepID=UPI0035B8DE6A
MTGQILAGRYEVMRLLGKQPGRQTILARDLQTKDLAVIKLLFLGNDFEWQDLKLFEREAETLKALSHPAIPRYLDYIEIDLPDNKGFALVQSYVEGKSLEEHLKLGRTFSEDEVKRLAKNLLKILIYLHEQKPTIIHRDIKPSNIILNNRSGHSVGQVYLVDFGSVQNQAAKFGGTITVVGTYGYMPPEQFGGRATPASDLYSLGATLIYLVTGRHPTELPQKDFRIQFQEVVNLSSALVDWLEWMTEPSLDKRLNSAIYALSALENPRIKSKATLAVKKPEDSDVILTKNSDYIEITLPSKGLNFVLISLVSCIIPLSFWAGNVLYSYDGSILISLIAIGSVWVFLAMASLFFLFRKVHLRIDAWKIAITNDLLGFTWKSTRPSKREDISEIVLFSKGSSVHFEYFGYFEGREDEGREEVGLRPLLIIQAGKQKYRLSKINSLTEEEIYWLTHELSDWLGLPITYK